MSNHFTKICTGSEVGSYLRLNFKAQEPDRTCSKNQEEEQDYRSRKKVR